MKAQDIRNMSVEEMEKSERDLKEEYAKLAFQNRIRPLENTARLSQIRKDMARIATVRGEKQAD